MCQFQDVNFGLRPVSRVPVLTINISPASLAGNSLDNYLTFHAIALSQAAEIQAALHFYQDHFKQDRHDFRDGFIASKYHVHFTNT